MSTLVRERVQLPGHEQYTLYEHGQVATIATPVKNKTFMVPIERLNYVRRDFGIHHYLRKYYAC